MNWSDSRKYCRDRGADLVTIKNIDKQKFISSFVKEIVWIGLSDIENEGKMKWVDESSPKQEFWAGGEPSNTGGNEDCVELIPSYDILKNWNNISCSVKKRGICEK
ncbi:CD209 antigen-like protein C [Carassius carassius]|uniref:CD209 antigen-like protein C n=1 Tax=Carassius carassius TaxID=217509 RepID=UPI0028697890|nr:CD209 antigen-like protein C [Carassius carassius]